MKYSITEEQIKELSLSLDGNVSRAIHYWYPEVFKPKVECKKNEESLNEYNSKDVFDKLNKATGVTSKAIKDFSDYINKLDKKNIIK